MSAQENAQVVQGVYAAFGRGNIPAFFDALADDVEWVIPYPADIPNGGTYRGKAGVREWLALTMENVEFGVLEPREFIAQGDRVVVLVHAEATIKRTGREVVQDAAHMWTLRAMTKSPATGPMKTRRPWSPPIARGRLDYSWIRRAGWQDRGMWLAG